MANEFKHKDPGAEMTSTEYISSDGTGHVFQSQATGDIPYAESATGLRRLAVGVTDAVLHVVGGIPAWATTLAGITLTTPTLTTPTIVDFTNASHDHADAAGGAAVVSSSVTVSGIVELATTAETTTGTDTGRAVTPDSLSQSVVFGTRYVQCVVFDSGTDIAEGDGKFFLHIPAGLNGMNLVEAHARVATAGSGSTVDVDFFLNTSTTNAATGNDMLACVPLVTVAAVSAETAEVMILPSDL